MQEVKRLELVDRPETIDLPRLPCRYFDLCGGTSTGGYHSPYYQIKGYPGANTAGSLPSYSLDL